MYKLGNLELRFLVNPLALELCNGIDDNCDSVIDEDTLSFSIIVENISFPSDEDGSITVTTEDKIQPFCFPWNTGERLLLFQTGMLANIKLLPQTVDHAVLQRTLR